jgi:hypothetical protein
VAIALQHPAKMPRAHAQDPRGLPKGDLPLTARKITSSTFMARSRACCG